MADYKSTVFGVIARDVSSPVGIPAGADIPIFTIALDDSKVYNVVEEYELSAADITAIGSDAKKVVMKSFESDGITVRKVGTDDLAGFYVWVVGHSENYLISSNEQSTVAGEVIITLEDDIGTALVETDDVKVRKFRGFKYITQHGNISSYLDAFYQREVDGSYDITTSEVGYYAIRNYGENGGSVFFILPVEYSDTKATLVSNLAPLADPIVISQLSQVNTATLMCCPKGYVPSDAAIAAADYQVIDGTYIDYVSNRAIDTTNDKRRMQYIYGVMSPTIATAESYQTDLNKNNYRTSSIFPSIKVRPALGVDLVKIDSAAGFCGLTARVHSVSANKEGQAPAGVQDGQFAGVVKLGVEFTRPDLVALQSSHLNTIVNFQGFYVHGDFTNFTTPGRIERNSHIVYAANRISNLCIPYAESFTMKPNNATIRLVISEGMRSICQSAVDDQAIEDYRVRDLTSTIDIQNNTGRWGIYLLHLGVLEFMELTFSSSLGEF